MNTNGNTYTVIYSAVLVILVAAILAYVSLALQPRQNDNIRVETMSKILTAAGLYDAEAAEAAGDINKFTIGLYNDNLQAAIYVNGNGEKTGTSYRNTKSSLTPWCAKNLITTNR